MNESAAWLVLIALAVVTAFLWFVGKKITVTTTTKTVIWRDKIAIPYWFSIRVSIGDL